MQRASGAVLGRIGAAPGIRTINSLGQRGVQALIDSNYRLIQASGHLARFAGMGSRGTINALGALTSVEAIQQGMDAFITGKDTEQSFAVACLFHEVLEAMKGKSLPDAIKNASLEEILPLVAMEFLAAK